MTKVGIIWSAALLLVREENSSPLIQAAPKPGAAPVGYCVRAAGLVPLADAAGFALASFGPQVPGS